MDAEELILATILDSVKITSEKSSFSFIRMIKAVLEKN